ncbi:MAG: hypothetical protein WEF50_23415 [Myxococcota bacterium]
MVAWSVLSAALLGVGFALGVAGIVVSGYLRTGNLPGEMQQHAWLTLATTVLEQALVPLWAATLASWLVLLRIAPRLDGAWPTLALGIAALAALWFAPVGVYCFEAWTPTSGRDVAATLALCAGGVSAALLLPRWAFGCLAPGALA